MTELVERIRENLKQSTKNIVTVELTVEFKNDETKKIENKEDLADIKEVQLETEIWDRYEKLQQIGRDRGHTIAGDEVK